MDSLQLLLSACNWPFIRRAVCVCVCCSRPSELPLLHKRIDDFCHSWLFARPASQLSSIECQMRPVGESSRQLRKTLAFFCLRTSSSSCSAKTGAETRRGGGGASVAEPPPSNLANFINFHSTRREEKLPLDFDFGFVSVSSRGRPTQLSCGRRVLRYYQHSLCCERHSNTASHFA